MGLFSWVKNLFSDDEKEAEKNVKQGEQVSFPSLNIQKPIDNFFGSTIQNKTFDKFDTYKNGQIDFDVFTPRTLGNPIYEAKKKAGLLEPKQSLNPFEQSILNRDIIKPQTQFGGINLPEIEEGEGLNLKEKTLYTLLKFSGGLTGGIEKTFKGLEQGAEAGIIETEKKKNLISKYPELVKYAQGDINDKVLKEKAKEVISKTPELSNYVDIFGRADSVALHTDYNYNAKFLKKQQEISKKGAETFEYLRKGFSTEPEKVTVGGEEITIDLFPKEKLSTVDKLIGTLAEGTGSVTPQLVTYASGLGEYKLVKGALTLGSIQQIKGSNIEELYSYAAEKEGTSVDNLSDNQKIELNKINNIISIPTGLLELLPIENLFSRVGGKSTAEIAEKTSGKPLKKLLIDYAFNISKTTAKGGGEEFFQEGASRFFTNFVIKTTGLKDISLNKDVWDNAVSGLLQGGFLSGTTSTLYSGANLTQELENRKKVVNQTFSSIKEEQVKDITSKSNIEDKEIVIHTQDTENGNEVTIKEVKPEVFQQEDKLNTSFAETKVNDIAFKLADLVGEQEATNLSNELKSKEYKDYKDFVEQSKSKVTELLSNTKHKAYASQMANLFIGEPDKVIVTEVKPIPDYIVDTKITEELLHSEKDNVPEIVSQRFTDQNKTQIAQSIAQSISTQVKKPTALEQPPKHIDIAEKESNYDKIGTQQLKTISDLIPIEIPKYLKVEKTKETPKYMALAMEAYDKLSIELPENADIDIEKLSINKVKQGLAREVNAELSKQEEKLMNYEIGKVQQKIEDIKTSIADILKSKYLQLKATQTEILKSKGDEGWLSNAPKWFTNFFNKNKKSLSDEDLKDLAHKELVNDSKLFETDTNGQPTERVMIGEDYMSLKTSKSIFEGILSSYEKAIEKKDNRVGRYINLSNALKTINKAEINIKEEARENKQVKYLNAKITEAKQLQPKEYASAFKNLDEKEKQLFKTDLTKFVDEFKDPYVIQKENGEFKFVDGSKVDNLSKGESIKFRLADKAEQLGLNTKDYFTSVINEQTNIKKLSIVKNNVYNEVLNSNKDFQELLQRKQTVVNKMDIIKESYKDNDTLIRAISMIQRKQMRDLIKEKVKSDLLSKFKKEKKAIKEKKLEEEFLQKIEIRYRESVFKNYKNTYPSLKGAIEQFRSRWARTLFTMPSANFERLMSNKFDPLIDHENQVITLINAINIKKQNLQIKNIKQFEEISKIQTIPADEKITARHLKMDIETLQKYLETMDYMQQGISFADERILKEQGIKEFFERPTAENKAEFNNELEAALKENNVVKLFDNRSKGRVLIKEIKSKEDLPNLEDELYLEPYIQIIKNGRKSNIYYQKGEIFKAEEFANKIITRDKFVEFLAKDFNVSKKQAEAIYVDFTSKGISKIDNFIGDAQFGETSRIKLLLSRKLIDLKLRLENSDIKIKREFEEKFNEARKSRKKSEFKDNNIDTNEILINYAENGNDISILSSATDTEKQLAQEIQNKITIADNYNLLKNKEYRSRKDYFPVIAKRLRDYMTDGKNVLENFLKWRKQRNLLEDIKEANRITQEELDYYKGISSESIFQHAKKRSGVIEGSRDAEYVYTKYFQEAERTKILNELLPEIVTISEFLKNESESKSKGTKIESVIKERLRNAQGFSTKKGKLTRISDDLMSITKYKFLGFEPSKQLVNLVGETSTLFERDPINFISSVPSYLFWNANQISKKIGIDFSTKQQINIDKILKENPAIASRGFFEEILNFKDFKIGNFIGAGYKVAERQLSVLSFIMHLNDTELETGILSPQRAAEIEQQIGIKVKRDESPFIKSGSTSSTITKLLSVFTGWRNFYVVDAINTMRMSSNGMSDLFRTIIGKERVHPEVTIKELTKKYTSFAIAYGKMHLLFEFQKYLINSMLLPEEKEEDNWWQKILRRALQESNSRFGAFASLTFQMTDIYKEFSKLVGIKEDKKAFDYIKEKQSEFEELIYANGLRGIDNTGNNNILLDQFVMTNEWIAKPFKTGESGIDYIIGLITKDRMFIEQEKSKKDFIDGIISLIPFTNAKDLILEKTGIKEIKDKLKQDRKESQNLLGSPFGFTDEDEIKAREIYNKTKDLGVEERLALIQKLEKSKDNNNTKIAQNLKTMFSNEGFSDEEKTLFKNLKSKQVFGGYLTDKQQALGIYRYLENKPKEEKDLFIQKFVKNKIFYKDFERETFKSLVILLNEKPEFTKKEYNFVASYPEDKIKNIEEHIRDLKNSGSKKEEIDKLIKIYIVSGIIDKETLKGLLPLLQ